MLSVAGGLQGTIQRPHVAGGASWSGAAADPETGLLYVPSENRFPVIKYYTPDPAAGGNLRYTQADFDSGVQPAMPRGLPLLKPPYSRRADRRRGRAGTDRVRAAVSGRPAGAHAAEQRGAHAAEQRQFACEEGIRSFRCRSAPAWCYRYGRSGDTPAGGTACGGAQ